jgi:hypothetical protein
MKNHNNYIKGITLFSITLLLLLSWTVAFAEVVVNTSTKSEEMPGKTANIGTRQLLPKPELLSRYVTALKQKIRKNWKTKKIPQPFRCEVEFTQLPGGDVISVTFGDCPDNKQARLSIEKALLKEPMPYLGFEFVFQRKIAMTLCYPEASCD